MSLKPWLGSLAVLGVSLPSLQAFHLQDSKGDVEAKNLDHADWLPLTKGKHPQKPFRVSGNPGIFRQNSEGLQIAAQRYSGEYSYRDDRTFNLDRLVAQINVVVDYNSDQAREWQIKNDLPPTALPGEATELTSAILQLNQTLQHDDLTLTHSFLLTDRSPGSNLEGKTEFASRMTGASGHFVFAPQYKGGAPKLHDADVMGPVHFHSVKTEINPKTGKPRVTEYDLVGDHLTADFSSPDAGQIVISGHVFGSSTQDGTFNADICIAHTDSKETITDIEMRGGQATIPLNKETGP